jgi:hypothetical protein
MDTDKTCVAIRVRPLNHRELIAGQLKAFKCQNNSIVQLSRDDVNGLGKLLNHIY